MIFVRFSGEQEANTKRVLSAGHMREKERVRKEKIILAFLPLRMTPLRTRTALAFARLK